MANMVAAGAVMGQYNNKSHYLCKRSFYLIEASAMYTMYVYHLSDL